jgi:hypothetical protein
MMDGPVNTYISFKRVSRFPNNARVVSAGRSSAGVTFVAALAEGDHPALLLKVFPERGPDAVLLRLDFVRLLDSVIGAEAAEAGSWAPLRQDKDHPHLWGNDQVSVSITKTTLDDGTGYAHLSYHRRDRAPIRDWRVGQAIKNQLCGLEWEAVEIYPAESRKVDTANEYWLWAFEGQFPFGFEKADLATQAQIDEAHVEGGGNGEGPVQRDNPNDDTSGFAPTNFVNPIRVPTEVPKFTPDPVITPLWVARCPNPTCEWESDNELSEAEARAAYDYHLKWAVHDDDVTGFTPDPADPMPLATQAEYYGLVDEQP